eukprot:scaffold121926_cov28-Prasinocladus_malaysianus.AAC.1
MCLGVKWPRLDHSARFRRRLRGRISVRLSVEPSTAAGPISRQHAPDSYRYSVCTTATRLFHYASPQFRDGAYHIHCYRRMA